MTTYGTAGSPSRPGNDPGLVRLLADALQSQDSFARDAGNLLYIYQNRKYRNRLVFRPFVRLIFAANAVARATDSSDAYFQRWLVLPFTQEFRGKQGEIPSHVLDAQLSASLELSGVLNRALAALPTVIGNRLLMTESMRGEWEEFRTLSDWVETWLDQILVEATSGAVPKKAIHLALKIEAERRRYPLISATALYRKIREHWPNVEESQRRLGQGSGLNSVECFVGLAWRSGVPPL
jgi:phage/plasmid-associated DNA primase